MSGVVGVRGFDLLDWNIGSEVVFADQMSYNTLGGTYTHLFKVVFFKEETR